MPAFNFFRLYPHLKDDLIRHLTVKGFVLVDAKTEQDNGVSFLYELFFTQPPKNMPVKWIKELQKQFALDDHEVDVYSAVVLVSFESKLYAISYGASHFYVSRYSDFEFGINIASRLVSAYKTKNSREFGGIKTKSIETYLSPDELAFEAGEAVNYIKGTPVNTSVWGKTISCGQSVQLRRSDLSVKGIHTTCQRLEAALSLPVTKEIPRSIQVKDSAQNLALTQQLISDMQQGHYMVSISPLQLSGVAFLFADHHEFTCVANGIRIEIDENSSLSEIDALVSTHFAGDYQKLLEATIEAHEDGIVAYQKSFICFIDYVDTQNNYYLEEGKWYQFDKNYLSNVRNEVNRIKIDSTSEIVRFDEAAYTLWQAQQLPAQRHYRERYLNELLAANHGYVNFDRDCELFEGAAAEITDLYRQNTIYIVKIGKPQKLNYAVDQATAAIRILERRAFILNVGGVPEKVQKVCLWLFFERETPISLLSEVNSLIFLMKLANWRKTVLMAGLQAEVRVSYR